MTESEKEKVANQKRDGLKEPKKFLSKLGLSSYTEIEKLLQYSSKLNYGDGVDFGKCRDFFKLQLPKSEKIYY